MVRVGKAMRAGHRLGGGVGGCSSGRTNGLTTRRGIRAVEFQPDFKTIQVGSKIKRTYVVYGHKKVRILSYLRPDRYSGNAQTAVRVYSKAGEEQHNFKEAAPNEKLGEGT